MSREDQFTTYVDCCDTWIDPDVTETVQIADARLCEDHADDYIAIRREESRMRSTEYRMVWG